MLKSRFAGKGRNAPVGRAPFIRNSKFKIIFCALHFPFCIFRARAAAKKVSVQSDSNFLETGSKKCLSFSVV
jgi:hypothetical protein